MQQTLLSAGRKSLAALTMGTLMVGMFGASLATIAPIAQAATPSWNATGTYVIDMVYQGTDNPHDMVLSEDASGNLTGHGGSPAGANTYTWVLNSGGSVSGDAIDFTANYTATADAVTPQDVLTVDGIIAPGGTMSGTWSDTYQGGNRTGTWSTTSGTAAPIVAPAGAAPTTLAATAITSSNATLNGVNGDTDASGSSFWVSTSTFSTASPTIPAGVYSTVDLGAQAAAATFSAPLSSATGLPAVTAGTTYYYAAWANVHGTWSPGAVLQFNTASAQVAPVVSSISPTTGSTAGGTVVTITGSGFTGETAVMFGSIAATGVVVNSDSSITATSPATTTAGVANITVTTPLGTSAMSEGDQFTYSASSGSIGGTVTGAPGVLTVTSITPVKTSAVSDNTYANGWSYLFNITVPTNEPNLSMSFANWLAADSNMIPVAGNMQISSAQALASTTPVTLSAANVYSSPLDMVGDLSTTTAGLQVQVLVQVKIPLNTVNDSYTTSYGVQTLH